MPVNVRIPLLLLGPGNPTMLNLSVANEVINTCNGVRGMKFLPEGIGKVDIAENSIVVTLNIPKPLVGNAGAPPLPPEPSNPYELGSTGGGSSSGGGSSDPPNADLSISRTDTWDRENPPLDIYNNPTDGVTFGPAKGPIRFWTDPVTLFKYILKDPSGSVVIGYRARGMYQRNVEYDANGGLYKIFQEHSVAGVDGSTDIEIVSIT